MRTWRILHRLKELEANVRYTVGQIGNMSKWCREYANREVESTAAIVHTQDQLTKLKKRVEVLELVPRCGHAECSGYEGCIRNSGGD